MTHSNGIKSKVEHASENKWNDSVGISTYGNSTNNIIRKKTPSVSEMLEIFKNARTVRVQKLKLCYRFKLEHYPWWVGGDTKCMPLSLHNESITFIYSAMPVSAGAAGQKTATLTENVITTTNKQEEHQ